MDGDFRRPTWFCLASPPSLIFVAIERRDDLVVGHKRHFPSRRCSPTRSQATFSEPKRSHDHACEQGIADDQHVDLLAPVSP